MDSDPEHSGGKLTVFKYRGVWIVTLLTGPVISTAPTWAAAMHDADTYLKIEHGYP